MAIRFLAILAAALVAGPPAWGQAKRDAARTEVLAITAPEGFVVSLWQGGSVEVGEYTPPDQTGPDYVDLMGYSVIPLGSVFEPTEAALRKHERTRVGCRRTIVRERQHLPGWFATQTICVGRDKAANPEDVEIEFAISRLGREGAYRIWRTWRGTPAKLSAMLKARTGQTLAPVRGSGAQQSVDEAALDAAFAALATTFEADLGRHEICDLAADNPCRAFKGDLPEWVKAGLKPGAWIAGFHTAGAKALSREQFRERLGVRGPDDGTPQVLAIGALPHEVDFVDQAKLDRLLQMIAVGAAADGGAFVIREPESPLAPAAKVRIRAGLVAAARRLQRPGSPPSFVTIVIAPGP